MTLLTSPQRPKTAGELRDRLEKTDGVGVDPEDLWALEQDLPYTIDLSWTQHGPEGTYDVVCRQRTAAVAAGGVVPAVPREGHYFAHFPAIYTTGFGTKRSRLRCPVGKRLVRIGPDPA